METIEAGYEQTPTVGELAKALALAQGEMENAIKESVNPQFSTAARKSTYADLASVREAAKPIYKHGLSVVQQVLSTPDAVGVRTMLLHASGEWMASRAFVKSDRPGPQAAGAVITYLRRYMLAAMLGIAQEDDDANAGTFTPAKTNGNGNGHSEPPRQQPKPEPTPPAGPWRAQGDDGTLILDAEITDFDELIKSLGWRANFVGMFLEQRFGVKTPRSLTRQQFRACAKLLLANGQGKEKYQQELASQVAAGQVKP